MGLLLLSLLSEAGFSKVTCQHDTFVSPAPSSAPPPAPEAVLGSWRDLAETRGDVQAPSESHGTQHSSHGCALGESHGVCGGVQHVVTAPQCQLLWLFIISIFKKKKKKSNGLFVFPVPLLCLLLPLLLGEVGGGGGELVPSLAVAI